MARNKDHNQILREAVDNYTTLFDYDGSGNPIYIGRTTLGSSTSSSSWQIRQLTYSGDNVTAIKWPEGSDAYLYIWDNRTGYSYS